MNQPSILLVVAAVFILVLAIAARNARGRKGELRVARKLRRLSRENYKVLNDVLIRTSRGSTQIDHIVVSVYGIFVIETKTFTGWIHGHENSESWTQSIYEKKIGFRNPIKQNWAHVCALKEVLSDFDKVKYDPITVFAGNAELKNVYSRTPVVYCQELVRTIVDRSGEHNLTSDAVQSICLRLNEVTIHDRRARREHRQQVRKQKSDRVRNEKALVCPRCGVDLVMRNGRYGTFYGCTNYPECTYTLRHKRR